ncbi:hypothetical protein CEY16_02805 [Halalkalibacillus sediminis]|uniref:Uncharacterized protein n=1 Tax=Halalkalibacillus sediminis TaxID=2018042 RepID=A0A2I0QWI2_9BACI|nr:hypothetical protein [Halalkalibacillus sediminis]PKR78703.1 hypothetical protein CEY16_02805 [Halalkalibacillus sediminis]
MKKIIASWFIKTAWPFILKLLIRYAEEIVQIVIYRIKKMIKESQLNKEKVYNDEIAEKEGQLAQTTNESVKARLRKEIHELKIKLESTDSSYQEMEQIIRGTEEKLILDVKEKTKELKADEFINKNTSKLELKDSKTLLLDNDKANK